MTSDKSIRVAVIDLGFGAEFIPIYQHYRGQRWPRSAGGRKPGSTNAATAGKSSNGTTD